MIKSRHDTAFFQRSYSSGLDQRCCMDRKINKNPSWRSHEVAVAIQAIPNI
ncbi:MULTISPECIES: hypothetical protein [unclassified Rickettsia]|uniref:hypothetical protein n=1 Tax=unclassified Rickettsia TaxID=114295 RepID=UPI003132CD1D